MELIAVIISAVAFCLSLYQLLSDRNRTKKESTLHAFNLNQNEVFDPISKMDIKSINPDKREDWRKLTTLMARIEHFCVGINTGIYDIRIVNKLGGNYMLNLYNRLLPHINMKESLSSGGQHYNEYRDMIKRLKKIRKM